MSAYQRFLKYLTTERGRQFSLYCAVGVGFTGFLSKWAPNTVLMSYYKEVVASYKNGFEQVVPEKLKERFQKAKELLQLDEIEASRMDIFHIVGFDTFHIGTGYSRFGSLIGAPVSFTYDKPDDIPKSQILVENTVVDWSSEAGRRLENALVLTEDEQIFALSREILQTQSLKKPLEWAYPVVVTLLGYSLGHNLNNKFNLLQKPRQTRMLLYTLVLFFTGGLYCMVNDMTSCYFDKSINEKLADLGPRMAKAGNDYYEKLILRNRAIRDISGDNSTYSASGNINYLFRRKHIPVTVHKGFFESKIKSEELGA